ncbi:BLUF domain-containing protein [Reinekea sp.]|jgi:uncharacterized Fe-S cluster-containing MiaB family protein|uniref:BLUF domain-containing protein n=1 Tax=Reinekea sp. TaxID=1970455 RepID=UPI002A82FABC|nr:BLUF domain-containing protein [Reinekea sp.]
MNTLCQLIYVSSTTEILNEETLSFFLESFRSNNKEHDITGLLLYNDGNIMQVIEGRQDNIDHLFGNIEKDKRHTGIILLVKENILKREFSDWAMSFRNISGVMIDASSDFMSTGLTATENNLAIGKAKKLLLSFRGASMGSAVKKREI